MRNLKVSIRIRRDVRTGKGEGETIRPLPFFCKESLLYYGLKELGLGNLFCFNLLNSSEKKLLNKLDPNIIL